MKLHPILDEILFTSEEIEQHCKKLGTKISKHYQKHYPNKPIVLLGILKGCVAFMAHLIKYITVPIRTEYIIISSYANTTQSNLDPKIILDYKVEDPNTPILIVEDILDTGTTLKFLIQHLEEQGSKDIETVVFLNKKECNLYPIKPLFEGAKIPNKFVVGFGFDFSGKFRNLPYVATVNIDKLNNYDWTTGKEA